MSDVEENGVGLDWVPSPVTILAMLVVAFLYAKVRKVIKYVR